MRRDTTDRQVAENRLRSLRAEAQEISLNRRYLLLDIEKLQNRVTRLDNQFDQNLADIDRLERLLLED